LFYNAYEQNNFYSIQLKDFVPKWLAEEVGERWEVITRLGLRTWKSQIWKLTADTILQSVSNEMESRGW